jgi:hypothetical protein
LFFLEATLSGGFFVGNRKRYEQYERIRMNPQEPLWHEDFRDALRHAVKAMGGYEVVGKDLWPAKSPKAAGCWLSDCLNPERAAKFSVDEMARLLKIARAAGVHCAMNQLHIEAGYAPPVIAPDRTPEQDLAEMMQRHAAEYARLANEHAAVTQARKVSNIR